MILFQITTRLLSTLSSQIISSHPAAYYLPNPSPGKNILSPEESFHCVKVNRQRPGDVIEVLDGHGGIHPARIITGTTTSCQIDIAELQFKPARDYRIELVISPTKNLDRIEWLVEKTIEMGIDKISLVSCQYSERRSMKTDRLRKKAIGALKQSRNPILPEIRELITFSTFLSSVSPNSVKFIAHPSPESAHLFKIAIPGDDYLILIGPEGGFSPEEVDQAKLADFTPNKP